MAIDLLVEDGLAEVVLNRPDRLNAIDADHFEQLNDALGTVVSASARAVLIRAEGRSFCAGRDLGDMEPEVRTRRTSFVGRSTRSS